MKKDIEHTLYYVSLLGILILGLFLIIYFSPKRDLQMVIIFGMSFSYVLLGIIHHFINHDLVAKIVIEYVLIAAFGVAAVYFILKGGFGF